MGRVFGWLMFIFILTITVFLSLLIYVIKDINYFENTEMPQIETKQEVKKVAIEYNDSVFSLMNKTTDEVVELLGEPARKDKTAYSYTWWIYNDLDTYMQLGILNDQVETVFAAGGQLESEPLSIGDSYNKLLENFTVKRKVTYEKGISHYTFLLNDEDIKLNPLIQLDDNLFVQAYIDSFTNKISSLRILTGDLLISQRFYEMEYRGTLPAEPDLSGEDWLAIQDGMERQIFDVTNVFRDRHGLELLENDELVSEVAYFHSKDMHDQQYFSHESKDGRGLKDRIESKNVYYVGAGENIAAQHSDALAAMQGWLNSKGHRETMLNEQYNYLGVGVHRLYYTQNFIFKH